MPDKRKIGTLLTVFFLIALVMVGRFFYLQVLAHDKFYKQAANQRSISVKLSDNRGMIYDRNLIPMVGSNRVTHLVVFPEKIIDKREATKVLSEVSGESGMYSKLSAAQPFQIKLDGISEDMKERLEDNNIFVLEGDDRYGESNLARHIIGYTAPGDGHGRSGIEKAFDGFLYSLQGKYVGVVTDAVHRSIEGLGVRFINESGFKGEFDVKLTLDYHIQRQIENCMDSRKISGSVVVLKADTGDILGMASRPDFRQDSVELYMNSGGSQLVNRAVSAYNIGSIFKIVVAAAVLENSGILTPNIFHCEGKKKVQDRFFGCSASHGLLNLNKAFAVSCNSAFIELGQSIGKDRILEMAQSLGFGSPTNLSELGLNESKGNLPDSRYSSEKEVANISIGQGEILATPLQVAGLAAVAANNGIKTGINLVDSVIDSRGRVVKKIENAAPKRVLSEYTARRLRSMMEDVTDYGTGTKANIQGYGGTAGKTGTAETGWAQGESTKVHAWFAGYFPREEPEYVMVVMVENGQSGSDIAAPVFREIAEGIMKLGRR